MPEDLQRASMWKRISAYLFDAILLVTVAVGVAFLLSVLFRYDAHTAERELVRQDYERTHGVTFDIEAEEYAKLTEEERARIDTAYAAFAVDPEVGRIDMLIINLTLIITTFSVLILPSFRILSAASAETSSTASTASPSPPAGAAGAGAGCCACCY